MRSSYDSYAISPSGFSGSVLWLKSDNDPLLCSINLSSVVVLRYTGLSKFMDLVFLDLYLFNSMKITTKARNPEIIKMMITIPAT
uniref:Uncharacterized protein n=1 Tax=Arion vulgaris TaxID=1028688 RepID=A0A0B6Z0G2_9EUPU